MLKVRHQVPNCTHTEVMNRNLSLHSYIQQIVPFFSEASTFAALQNAEEHYNVLNILQEKLINIARLELFKTDWAETETKDMKRRFYKKIKGIQLIVVYFNPSKQIKT